MKRGSPAAAASARSVRSINYATSPLLASKTPPWRSRFVMVLIGIGFLLLLAKAVFVQIWATDFYQAKGDEKYLLTEKLSASRGRILDRNGLLLAGSVGVHTVQVDARSFAADTAQRKELARLLALPPSLLGDKLDGAKGTVVLRRQVDADAWAQVKALGIKGVHEIGEFTRRYPEGEAAAHVVGFTDIDDHGKAGAELAFEGELLGTNGIRTVVRDRLGRVVDLLGETQPPANGHDIELSIDSRIQSFAWQRLRETVAQHGASAGSVVVLDSRTGEVLAMANYPGYDPGNLAQRNGEKLRNIALADTFEPGSTMKPLSISLALERGPWTPNTPIDTSPGRIQVADRVITDSHAHGVLTVAQVVQKSSNVGTVKIALQIPKQELWNLYSAVGLGRKPDTPFQGVASGKLRPVKTLRPVEHASMSYGYALSASLFQLARAYTVFARDGEIVPVTLLKRDPALPPVEPGQRVLSARTAQQMREMLRMAANSGGTAPKAQESTLGYSVGGKTGTARVHAKGGYTNRYRTFYVGLAPISNPRLVVAVMVAEPTKGSYYAGDVAAPLFGQVMEKSLRLMNVEPDMDVKAQLSAKPATAEVESF